VARSNIKALLISLVLAASASATNSITVTNTGSTTSNYPVQIGRAFAQGEIPSGQSPQASVNGTPVSTQVDAKTAWSDGSLRHAVISFLIPTFTSATTYTVTFAAGTTVGNTALTQSDMLDAAYDFDAVISLTRTGVTKTASARTMLTAGDYTVWASGPIATTILLGNHAQGTTCGGAAASTYDFGFTSFCAFRPLFQATFWATTHQVFVRYIGEIANTEQLENVVTDSMSLTIGSSSPTTVYTRATALTMNGATRWTKTAWLGGTPPVAGYNHNLSYLATAKALPNYDTSKTVSGASITSLYSAWTSASKDLYQKGVWDSSLSAGGAHTHVGPYPAWNVRWLYAGEYRTQEIAIGQTELFAAVEYHYREGKAGKKLDQALAVSGMGYPVSASSRPTTQWANGVAWTNTNVADRIVAVGTVTGPGWGFDGAAHTPDPFSSIYLVTGDYFFLEEGMFLAGFQAHWVGSGSSWVSRGPTGKEGGLVDKGNQQQQLRGIAWSFRTRVEIATLVPDANPYKAHLVQLIADAIALWEGQRNITTSAYNGNTMWTHGYNKARPASGETFWDSWECGGANPACGNMTVHPLHFWDMGNATLCEATINTAASVQDCHGPWWQNYMIYALGRGKELGYPTNDLLAWVAPQVNTTITDPTYNPYLAAAYRVHTIDNNYTHFTTWAAVKAAFTSTVANATSFNNTLTASTGNESVSDGNVQPLNAAAAMVADQANGTAAWAWVSTNILPSISGDMKWAILPRSAAAAGGASTGGAARIGGKVTR
jgi:hypothetical protein